MTEHYAWASLSHNFRGSFSKFKIVKVIVNKNTGIEAENMMVF